MSAKSKNIIFQNKTFLWIVLATFLLLLVPLTLMIFRIPLFDPGSGYELINWDFSDFIIMGTLIFAMGSLFILTARRLNKKKRLAVGIVIIIALLLFWIHLAVGIVDSWPLAGS